MVFFRKASVRGLLRAAWGVQMVHVQCGDGEDGVQEVGVAEGEIERGGGENALCFTAGSKCGCCDGRVMTGIP